MVLQEAANEPYLGLVAIAGVALDRVSDSRWPATARGVVYQPNQFTAMGIRLRRYSRDQITRARKAVQEARSGVRPCGKVLYYHSNGIIPDWDYDKIEIQCMLGEHIFYGDK
jgi:N-acetylmuramoyl-L-alanine amidase